MDRTAKIQIGYIVIGVFLIAFPFLVSAYYYNNMLFLAIWGIGVIFVLDGIIYRTTAKLSKKRKNEFGYKEGSPKTNGELIGIIGLIVFVTSLVLGLLSDNGPVILFLLFCVLFAVGTLILIISNIVVREERRKERQKQSHVYLKRGSYGFLIRSNIFFLKMRLEIVA
jgi:hypothetical protein